MYQPPSRRLARLRRLGIVPCLAALAAAAGACGDAGAGDGEGEARRPPAVEAVPARSGSLPLEERLSGVVEARNQVAIRPEIEATVVEVMARDGEAVRAGEPLVRLEDDSLADRLRQAEASLRLASGALAEARAAAAEIEAQVRRTRALAADELVSTLELETREAQLEAARARVEQAEARVDEARATVEERRTERGKTLVRAPVSGRVGRRNAEVGMLVDPSTTLFLVGDLDELVVEIPLTERLLGDVGPGTPVEIDPGGPGGPIEAEISRISPFLDNESFSTSGEIDVDNPGGRLRPGMFVSVDVLYGASEPATLVPASALSESPETRLSGVFVVEDDAGLAVPSVASPGAAEARHADVPPEPRRVAFRPVEVLASGRGTAGVLGVGEGEWVVTVGQQLLHERSADLDTEADGAGTGGAAAHGAAPLLEARVRPVRWERVLELQGLQREDLLEGFLDKQRRVARTLGAELPESEAVVEEALRRAEPAEAGTRPTEPNP